MLIYFVVYQIKILTNAYWGTFYKFLIYYTIHKVVVFILSMTKHIYIIMNITINTNKIIFTMG